VERSVLAPSAVVEEGATVRDSILLPGVIVRRGAVVERAVLDDGAEVAAGVTVGGSGEVTLVAHGEQVKADVAAGARVPELDG
jgi:glucose-1-phosphate adenylyltransferase